MTQYHPIAINIYDLLIQDKITDKEGEIIFDFLNISVRINEKSAIGDLLQEWFAEWMRQNNIHFRTKQNTQEFPDFLIDRNSNKYLSKINLTFSEQTKISVFLICSLFPVKSSLSQI